MTNPRHIQRDDIRYMTHEQRIAEGFMAAPEGGTYKPAAMTTCRCGKTVTHVNGVAVRNPWREGIVVCPRDCE